MKKAKTNSVMQPLINKTLDVIAHVGSRQAALTMDVGTVHNRLDHTD
jgi:hypothetical protein